MAKKQNRQKQRYYLYFILNDEGEKKRFVSIFSKSRSFEECAAGLKKMYTRHRQTIPATVGMRKFIQACYAYAKRAELLSPNISGERRCWIFDESAENQQFFKSEYPKNEYRGKNGLLKLLAALKARGMKVNRVISILNAADSLGLPKRTELPPIQKEEIVPESTIKALEDHRKNRERMLSDTTSPSARTLTIKAKHSDVQQGACVAMISRLDFGGTGYRRGLVRLAGEVSQTKGAHFILIVGGLVDKRALSAEWNAHISAHFKTHHIPQSERAAEKEAELHAFCHRKAVELAEDIPHVRKPDETLAKYYIITSEAYDGYFGEIIGRSLTDIRNEDIVYWCHGTNVDQPIAVKYVDMTILPIVPLKPSWRSRYYSTSAQREIQDVEKRSAKKMPDFYAIGCFGGSVDRPKGECRRPWMMVPALHVIHKTHSAENQVGIRFLQIRSKDDYTITTRSFKGLIEDERELVHIPRNLTSNQKKIFNALVKCPLTVGQVEYALGSRSKLDRNKLRTELKSMMGKSGMIVHDDASGLYDFAPDTLRKRIVYPNPDLNEYCVEDRIVGFGCLHAGATAGDYDFFINQLPKFILERDATLLVAAGDLTEGLFHGLLERGEVLAGINNTQQELLAAHLIGEAIIRVFNGRIEKALDGLKSSSYKKEELSARVNACVIPLLYVPGNHDDWQTRSGTTPLKIFHDALVMYIKKHIETSLLQRGFSLHSLESLIIEKITRDKMTKKVHYVSPISGLSIKAVHPGTARNETVSALSQRVLAKWPDAQVIVSANWHVAVRVEEYDADLGQRLVLQCPTILTHTPFEDGKMKTTDFGVGFARIRSKKRRIIEVEGGFYGPSWKLNDDYDNVHILNTHVLRPLGVAPIVEHQG